MWKWGVNHAHDIWILLEEIRPYLRYRAEDADRVLDYIDTNYAEYIDDATGGD